MTTALLATAAVLGAVSLAMHALGTYGTPLDDLGGYYWRIWWWDALNHAIAGLAVALVAFVAADALLAGAARDVAVLGTVATVGLAWEAYEYAAWDEYEVGRKLYPEDTALDLAVELLGAALLLLADVHGVL